MSPNASPSTGSSPAGRPVPASRGPRRTISLPALFVFAFALGTALVGAGEAIAHVPGLATLGRVGLATAGPVLVMVAYFLVARGVVARGSGNTIDQVADSLYFLGFLFTLVALLSALVTLVEIDTAGIVSRFGLALVTTLAGLLAKVTLTQFTVGPDQRRDRADRALLAATQRFERALSNGADLLDRHVNSTTARIESGVDAVLGQATEAGAAHLRRLHDTGDEVLRTLGDTVHELAERSSDQRDRLDALLEALDRRSGDALERTDAELSAFVERAARHADALERTLGDATRTLGATTERHRGFDQALEAGQRRLEAHVASEGHLEAVADDARRLCGRVVEAAGRLEERAARERDESQGRTEALIKAIGSLVGELEALRRRRQDDERAVTVASVAGSAPVGRPDTVPAATTPPELPAPLGAGAAANEPETRLEGPDTTRRPPAPSSPTRTGWGPFRKASDRAR